jgi:hypothetical protein
MWGLLIANHLDQSLWSTNQKYWAAVRSNLLHSFLEVHNCVTPFTSHSKLHEFGAGKPISWTKLAHFDVFAINFTVCNHILRTGGDVLIILSSSYFRILLPWVQGTNKDDPFKGEPYHTISIKHFEVFLFVFESIYSHGRFICELKMSCILMLTFICIALSLSTYIQYITQNITNSTTHSNFKKYNSFATNKNLKLKKHTKKIHRNHVINNLYKFFF